MPRRKVRVSVRVKRRTRIARLGADVLIRNSKTKEVRSLTAIFIKFICPREIRSVILINIAMCVP